jgi:hypothetical protein
MGMGGGTGDVNGALIKLENRLHNAAPGSLERQKAQEEVMKFKAAYSRVLEAQRTGDAVNIVDFGRVQGWTICHDERLGIDYLPGYHPDD